MAKDHVVDYFQAMRDFEGEPNGSTETDAFNSIYYKDVPVSSYKGILGFAFQDDRLAMSAYAITGAEQDNYEKLRIALKTVYGDEAEKDPNELLSIINKTTEEQISEHDLQRYSISKWEISDGTWIYMLFETNMISILYFSPEYI